ncbi:malate synthase A [Paenibacillus validus]|uniref:malate synthase A n=1 Tax=Paenibacillus TaxID=44249 RepID=UPI000FDBBA00|nr:MULTISPECIES: malate synthase A [Paenibacillus]MED4599392.1 malate synthase A [Paenibacillus validus]MED4606296.1 malate synthase A [Paenibacillus validus]
MAGKTLPTGIQITGEVSSPEREHILSAEALEFVAELERKFGGRRQELLRERDVRQARIDAGERPDFLPETASVREGDWSIAPVPADLQDRRVEITGPAGDRKMVINAFNSGAYVYMADFEDANSPTWDNSMDGQVNLRDAVNGTIRYRNPDGKEYRLNDKAATLKVRPRGWHLEEKHIQVDGKPISAALLDFGLFFFHNARALLQKGSGPYFYLPKMESHREARLWNDVFVHAQDALGIPQGTIKATVLIETILAAFEMDEILYELREHSAGLNCGRWDYIFSYIKKLRKQPDVILPDRGLVTMETPFMRSYSLLAIQTCHKRGAHCIGGMAAQIPVKNDPQANEEAMHKVRADKLREVRNGHDGTWVAHPGLVPVAQEVFDEHMPSENQVDRQLTDIRIAAKDLLEVPLGPITEKGVRTNVSVGLLYLEAWLRGYGAVPIHNLMEDVATAEISRAQLWQWIHHPKGVLEDGRKLTADLFRQIQYEELARIEAELGEDTLRTRKFDVASALFTQMTVSPEFEDFLTLQGYRYLD